MEEHQGAIGTRADFDRYPWPDPSQAAFDHLHLGQLETLAEHRVAGGFGRGLHSLRKRHTGTDHRPDAEEGCPLPGPPNA